MCLSIWYDLQLPGDTSQADVLRTLIQLRSFARKLPMEIVSPIYTHSVGDLFKWPRDASPLERHFHQRAMVSLDHEIFETPNPELDAQCAAIGFVVHPGRGSDVAAFGFMRPGMTSARTDLGDDDDEFDEPWEDEGDDSVEFDEDVYSDWRLHADGDFDEDDEADDSSWKPQKIVRTCWWMSSRCMTQYASIVSAEHFIACHTAIIHLLDQAVRLGIKTRVLDPFDYWRTRSTEKLVAAADRANGVMARLL
jgi:hypothetical protein